MEKQEKAYEVAFEKKAALEKKINKAGDWDVFHPAFNDWDSADNELKQLKVDQAAALKEMKAALKLRKEIREAVFDV